MLFNHKKTTYLRGAGGLSSMTCTKIVVNKFRALSVHLYPRPPIRSFEGSYQPVSAPFTASTAGHRSRKPRCGAHYLLLSLEQIEERAEQGGKQVRERTRGTRREIRKERRKEYRHSREDKKPRVDAKMIKGEATVDVGRALLTHSAGGKSETELGGAGGGGFTEVHFVVLLLRSNCFSSSEETSLVDTPMSPHKGRSVWVGEPLLSKSFSFSFATPAVYFLHFFLSIQITCIGKLARLTFKKL